MAQIIDGKYIIELDELTSIALVDWIPFQPNTVSDQAYRISLTNFIKALPIIPAVAGEYDDIAALLAAQSGQTADVFYKVADPSDDPAYNDLKDSEIKSVYYHLVDTKSASLSDYNSVAIPKLESDKNAKLGNSLQALTFDVKFRSAEWSSNKATLQAIANALKISSPQDLLLDALSIKLNTDNNPADISRVLFGLDGQLIFEPIDSSKIQSDSDAGDVTLDDDYALLLTITGNQNITNGLANIGLTAKSFSTAAITAFQASGNNRVRATSAAHGFSEGDYVEIVNTANYDGIYEIKAVPNVNDFDFTATFVATETGDWEKSENREIAVDLRVNAISVKEFTRQIEGEGRLNFSEPLSGVTSGEDIDVYVKSNTVGEAIEILGTTQSSQLKVINSGNYLDKDTLTIQQVQSVVKFKNIIDVNRYINIKNFSEDNNLHPVLNIYNSRGTEGSPTYLTNGDEIGAVAIREGTSGAGAAGSGMNSLAQEDWNAAALGSDLRFFTTAIGATTKLVQAVIRSWGDLVLTKHLGVGTGATTPQAPIHIMEELQAGIKLERTSTPSAWTIFSGFTVAGSLTFYDNLNTAIRGLFYSNGNFELKKNLEVLGQATVQGKILTFTATPTFNFDDGNVQEMEVTAEVTSLTISNELQAGSYSIILIEDSTGGRPIADIPATGSTFGKRTDNSVTSFITAANDVNIIDIRVDVSGNKYYSIETVTA